MASEKVTAMIEEIKAMSVLELSELVHEIEDVFGVSAAAAVAAAPVAGAAAAAEEKTEFDVVLTGFGDQKIKVIKAVREITNLGLAEAKAKVEGVPCAIKEQVSKDEAEELKKKLEKGTPLNIKLGVDPTSPDLHLGHAVPLRKMRQFQDLGHNVTLIIGNGTALIGDPSGKNSTRPQLSQEQIEANAETYVSQAMKILDPEKTTIVHNGDWILSMDLAGLLQVCSKFTVARILERDDFTKRYQSQTPIALHEFLYPVMQAYDSVQIKADVEMGGTDQLFNLLAGRELMEKMGMEPQIALTMPLLEGTDGVRKMSKSYGNYIGLTDAPKDMFGKTMSIPDEMIGKYYRLASSLTPAEVDKIDAALADGSADPYELKRALGRDLCDTYHGAGAGDEAQAEFDRVFKEGQLADFPEKHVELTVNDEGQIYLAGLLKDLGLSASAGQARRDIDGGGVKINGKAVAPKSYNIDPSALKLGDTLSVGKRKGFKLV